MTESMSQRLAPHADTTYAYLTTVGRTSGEPHRIEIWFAVDGDRVLLMSGGRDRSDWVKNLVANPRVRIEIEGEAFIGTARVVSASEPEDALARDLLVAKYQKADELTEWRVNSLPVLIAVENEAADS